VKRRPWLVPAGALVALVTIGAAGIAFAASAAPHPAHSEPTGCRIELYRAAGTFDPICPPGAQPPADLADWPVVVYP
jgi:hypothetical protein